MRERPGSAVTEPPSELLSRVSALATSRRRPLTRAAYLEGILAGQRTILARAITLIESSRESDRLLAEQIVEDCLPHCGNSIRVGITGIPGAGKSCLIETLGRYLTEERGEKVAVLAIDFQPDLRRQHTRRQDTHGHAGGKPASLHTALTLARVLRRRRPAHTRSHAVV